METKITQSEIIKKWISTQKYNTISGCIGDDINKILAVADCFSLQKLPQHAQTLWEFPLSGERYCDLSFCYNKNILTGNSFCHENGGKIEPLLRHLLNIMPDFDIWTEIDLPDKIDEIAVPSVFINVLENTKIILNKTWAKNSEPPQWSQIQKIYEKLTKKWRLHYIGLMPGRENNPIRLIFKRPERLNRTVTANVEHVHDLLDCIGFPLFPSDVAAKLAQISKFGFNEWEIGVDLYPDNSFGKILGVEIALLDDEVEHSHFQKSGKLLNLQKKLQQWDLADERILLLQNLINKQTVQFLGEKYKALIYTFLSHIKLRWDGDMPLDAKAYLTHNYSLYE